MRTPGELDDDFQETRPLREHQERLHAQWGRPRAHYRHNQVNVTTRVLLALVSATWVSWALIGLLSGHMFFFALILPLHLTGWPALMFSVGVLLSAAACCVSVVDHYDRRDNEHRYRQARRQLWRAAAGVGMLAIALHVAEYLELLPGSRVELGLMSVERLQSLLNAEWLQRWLLEHHDGVHSWWWITALWCFAGLAALKKLGMLEVDAPDLQAHGGFLIASMSMIVPAGAAFSLYLLDQLTLGHLVQQADSAGELRQTTAWMLTLLVTTVSITAFFGITFVFSVLQQLGWLAKPAPTPVP